MDRSCRRGGAGVGCMPTSLCVLHQCVKCPWTQEVWQDPMFGFLYRRDGPLPQPLLQCVGAHGPLSLPACPWGFSPPFAAWEHGAQAWNSDRQAVEQGL